MYKGGCDRRSVCANEFGIYRCLPQNSVHWKFIVCFTIISSLAINYAYVLKRAQISSSPIPPNSIVTFYLTSIGSLVLLVSFVFGPLTSVSPLALSGSILRLWLNILRGKIKFSFFYGPYSDSLSGMPDFGCYLVQPKV